jgi:NAD(P)-dependent dehydrogenase (short-subunit alcohol dehydrogenase family)
MNTFVFSDVKDKVCVITGGSGVIGYALCESLLASGVKLAIVDKNPDTASGLFSQTYGDRCIVTVANVLDRASLQDAKKIINDRLGSIDFLINGAGGNSPKATTQIEQLLDLNLLDQSFFGLDIKAFQDVFDLNFTGTLLPTMVFAQDMLQKQKGSILNISSMNSFRPLTKIPAYSAAKASVNNFTQWLAVHLAKTGIRVNAIAPGFLLTHQNRFLLQDPTSGELTARGQKILSNTPMGKFGLPEDLQGITLFLLSDLSSFITGVIVPVDGGYSAYGGV